MDISSLIIVDEKDGEKKQTNENSLPNTACVCANKSMGL